MSAQEDKEEDSDQPESEWTTWDALNLVLQAKTIGAFVFWTFITVASVAGMACSCAFLIVKYNRQETIYRTKLVQNRGPFPAVTLCNMNPYKTSALALFPEVSLLVDEYEQAKQPDKTVSYTQETPAEYKRQKRSLFPLPAFESCGCNYASTPSNTIESADKTYDFFAYPNALTTWNCSFTCCANSPNGNGTVPQLQDSDVEVLKKLIPNHAFWVAMFCRGSHNCYWYSDPMDPIGNGSLETPCSTCKPLLWGSKGAIMIMNNNGVIKYLRAPAPSTQASTLCKVPRKATTSSAIFSTTQSSIQQITSISAASPGITSSTADKSANSESKAGAVTADDSIKKITKKSNMIEVYTQYSTDGLVTDPGTKLYSFRDSERSPKSNTSLESIPSSFSDVKQDVSPAISPTTVSHRDRDDMAVQYQLTDKPADSESITQKPMVETEKVTKNSNIPESYSQNSTNNLVADPTEPTDTPMVAAVESTDSESTAAAVTAEKSIQKFTKNANNTESRSTTSLESIPSSITNVRQEVSDSPTNIDKTRNNVALPDSKSATQKPMVETEAFTKKSNMIEAYTQDSTAGLVTDPSEQTDSESIVTKAMAETETEEVINSPEIVEKTIKSNEFFSLTKILSAESTPSSSSQVSPEVSESIRKMLNDPGVKSDQNSLDATALDILPYLTVSLQKKAEKAGYTREETIIRCSYNGVSCSQKEFTVLQDPSYGNCYTFNKFGDHMTAYDAGKARGLSVMYNIGQQEYLSFVQTSGIKVAIHSQDDLVFPDVSGYSVPSGYLTSISLRKSQAKAVRSLNKPCAYSSSDAAIFYCKSSRYSTEGCWRSCTQMGIIQECKCGDPTMPLPLNDTVHFCDCVNSFQRKSHPQCDCPQPCQDDIYEVTISKARQWPITENGTADGHRSVWDDQKSSQLSLVEVYFEDLVYIESVESQRYSILDLMWDISQVIGLFSGISVLSLFEVVSLVEYLFYSRARKPA